MAREAELRQSLFDQLSANLSLYAPVSDVFVCPLCLTGFTRKDAAVDTPAPRVNLAHVIPETLGGKLCTLTCAKCNSTSGHELEPFLMERFAYEDFTVQAGSRNARMSGEFGNVGVDWIRTPGHSDLRIIAKQSNPADIERLQERMEAGSKEGMTFNLRFSYKHKPGRTEAAFYQSAYLMMFAYFGYDFAFRPQYAPIRERICNPDTSSWETRIVGNANDDSLPFVKGRDHALLFPWDIPVIFAVMRFRQKEGRERLWTVVLPGLDGQPVPDIELRTFQGLVPKFRPEEFLTTKCSLRLLWDHVRESKPPQGGMGAAPLNAPDQL